MGVRSLQIKLLRWQKNLRHCSLFQAAHRNHPFDIEQNATSGVCADACTQSTSHILHTLIRKAFKHKKANEDLAYAIIGRSETHYYLHYSFSDTIPEGSFTPPEITNAINTFNDEYRIPFSMLVAGYRYNEIANTLHIPLTSVKNRILIASNQLHTILHEHK